ncbi:hypothetical protein [Ralstonia pseudosolanacearum]|uniref:hypothetical protein n=1 Tax=Ralstonia pseudosolanacearum TaxID=1310165 RepID=UPI001FF7424B|nr:hypothetical protein [Ralstonia pseudosolanacearum]
MGQQLARNPDPRQVLRALLRSMDDAPAERKAALQAALARAAETAGVSVEELRDYAMGPRQYDFNGLAGCVEQRRSRLTGTLAGLYEAEQSGMDPEAGRWVTVCEDHSSCVNHATLAAARAHLADPSMWCDACRDAHK